MLKQLPTLIDPKHLALQNSRLQGKVSVNHMERLRDSLGKVELNDEVYIDWLFTLDEQNRPMINGYTQSQLPFLCQRCLQVMSKLVKSEVALLITDEKENGLPENYEPLTIKSVPTSLLTLIEDELILALPIVAAHEECPSNEHQLLSNFAPDDSFQNNPFRVLEKIKKT